MYFFTWWYINVVPFDLDEKNIIWFEVKLISDICVKLIFAKITLKKYDNQIW